MVPLLLPGSVARSCEMDETRHPTSVKRILRYFVRNPEAMDTYEGIVRWRLSEEAIHRTTAETQEALAWLVSQSFLREVSVTGGLHFFRLNPDKRDEAEAFLQRSLKDYEHRLGSIPPDAGAEGDGK